MDTPATSGQAQDTDERALRKVFLKLVEEMKATDVIDELYVCNLLRREEYEGILDACSKEDSKPLNRRVLMAMSRRPPGFAAKLAEIFRKTEHSYLADALEEALAEVSRQPRADPAPTPDPSKDVQPSSSGSGVTSGPMSKWNVDALEALKGKLKLNVKMIQLVDMLHTAAGGFMNSAEAQSVRDKTGDTQQIEQVIDILQGKGDKEFATFCQILQTSNYQGWARKLELEAEKFKTSDAVPDTNPAPHRQNPQAVMSARGEMPGPSREGGIPTLSANSTTHPLSPTLNNICWPEFPALQDEFSTLVSKLSLTLQTLENHEFVGLLAYLRERLRPMVDGCFPTEGSPNIPKGITASELVQHLQDCHYWDYLNTELLEGIIRHVPGEGGHLVSLMTEYKKNICSKVECTLKECRRKNVKPEPPPHYNIMAVVIDPGGNLLSFHLYQILQLKNLLVQKFGMSSTLFHGFTEGSIVLYFYIPEEAVYSLCPKLEANCTALEELHVTTLVVFGHFSVDVGYQQMSLLHKSWPPRVSYLEEVARLKQELKKSEVDREELSAELRGFSKIIVKPGVHVKESLGSMKPRWREERDEGEEPDRKKVETEEADTLEVKLESHPQEEKEQGECLYEPRTPSIISEHGPQTPSMFPPPSPYSTEHSLELAVPTLLHPESIEMGPPKKKQPRSSLAMRDYPKMVTPAQTSAQAQDTDERALRKVFSKLVRRMKATDVIDELYECNLLMREEYEGILDACSKEDSKTLNRRVLMDISRRPPGFAAKLAEIFREKHSYLADALEEALAQVNSQPRADPALTPDPSKDAHPSSSGSTVTSGPMSKWNVDALVALKGKFKLNVKMIALANILETPAGGFMSRTEAQSVRAKTGDDQQMELVIEILLGKSDKEFATFCQMLWKSNYQVWARELEVEAEKFKISDALPGTDPAPLRGYPQAVVSTKLVDKASLTASRGKKDIMSQKVTDYSNHLKLFRVHVSRAAAGKGRAVLEGLELDSDMINKCFQSNPLNEEEAVMMGLEKWKSGQAGLPPTWKNLVDAMNYAQVAKNHVTELKKKLGLP